MGNSIINALTCGACSNSNNEDNRTKVSDKEEMDEATKETFERLKKDNQTPLPKNLLELRIQTKDMIQKREDNVFDHYKKISELGSGAFGTVYKVQNIASDNLRAMKVISKELIQSGVDAAEISNEIQILSRLDHPNIMRVYEFFEDKDNFYIITEYCDQGDLAGKMDEEGKLSELLVKYFMNQVFIAISYLHSQDVFHGDIKRENILLESLDESINAKKTISSIESDKNINNELKNTKTISDKTRNLLKELSTIEVKLVDFGAAKMFSPHKRMSGIIGTTYYCSPEVIDNLYREECDEWACGVLMYILLTGYPPFDGDSEEEIFNKIKNDKPNLRVDELKNVSRNCKNLILQLLQKDPEERIKANDALQHPFFTENINFDDLLTQGTDMSLLTSLRSSMAQKTKFQDAVIAYIALNFTDKKEEQKIKEIFRSMSKDHSTFKIDIDMFVKCLTENKIANAEEAKEIFYSIDNDRNGSIEYQELVRGMSDKKKLLSDSNLKEAFDFFDVDKSNTITWDEIARIVFQGKTVPKELINSFLKEIGKTENDPISFKEFCEMIRK